MLEWHGETRVFAATNGSLVTQHTMRGGTSLSAITERSGEYANYATQLDDARFAHMGGGFETALQSGLAEGLRPLGDMVERWNEIPVKNFDDVGRFPVVFDGMTAARAIGCTLDAALDGDRVSGLEADASGGSFLAPANDVLRAEKPQFSPLLSMHVSRAMPSPMAMQWDDDGVVPEPYTVLQDGRVVDYHTTRETAPMLAQWYAQHGKPLRSHGGCVAPKPTNVPRGTGGHVTVPPATTAASFEALTRELTHGFIVVHGIAGSTPGLTAGWVRSNPYDGFMMEVRRGVPVARVGVDLQFKTQLSFGKNLLAIGDASTVGTGAVGAEKGIPWELSTQWVTAPAMLCKDIEITRFS